MLTIFTSSYNHARYLPEAIESVLNQSYRDFEYILIDDGSTDDSFNIMCDYAYQDDRIHAIALPKQVNKGPVLNRSIHMMEGSHWLWCPADDIWTADLLAEKVAFANQLPAEAIIYNDYYYIDELGTITGQSDLKNLTPETFIEEVWKTSPIGFTGIMIPQIVLKDIPFPEHITYSEDFYWMIKATIHKHPFYHCRKRLHYKRKHSTSVTAQNLQAVLDDVPRIRAELLEYKTQRESL